MSLFQCDVCGCCENTAKAARVIFADLFDWGEFPERKGMLLCSACGPSNYSDGKPTGYGRWHGETDRVFLPMGQFKTNNDGNLEHTRTGFTDYHQYSLTVPKG